MRHVMIGAIVSMGNQRKNYFGGKMWNDSFQKPRKHFYVYQ